MFEYKNGQIYDEKEKPPKLAAFLLFAYRIADSISSKAFSISKIIRRSVRKITLKMNSSVLFKQFLDFLEFIF